MSDLVDSSTRSRMMANVASRNTRPEMAVRKALFSQGFRFRLHSKNLPGHPDIVMPGRRIVIFVHGCFWHLHSGCRYAKIPATRSEFWRAKLNSNVQRDARTQEVLISLGWRVLVVWECAIRSSHTRAALPLLLANWVFSKEVSGEIDSNLILP